MAWEGREGGREEWRGGGKRMHGVKRRANDIRIKDNDKYILLQNI